MLSVKGNLYSMSEAKWANKMKGEIVFCYQTLNSWHNCGPAVARKLERGKEKKTVLCFLNFSSGRKALRVVLTQVKMTRKMLITTFHSNWKYAHYCHTLTRTSVCMKLSRLINQFVFWEEREKKDTDDVYPKLKTVMRLVKQSTHVMMQFV